MTGVVKKIEETVFQVINSSLLLAQVFVVILFFENFFILKQNISLFNPDINLKAVGIAPILWFFLFIACSKITWAIFQFTKDLIFIKSGWDFGSEAESNVSFTAFLLIILIFVYLVHLGNDDINFYPFHSSSKFLQSLYITPFFLTLIVCLFLNLGRVKDEQTTKP